MGAGEASQVVSAEAKKGNFNSAISQNSPNPANRSTAISFQIPKSANVASVVITEFGSGKIVKIIPVSTIDTQISLPAGSLAKGIYAYTLFIDGKKTETRQMIITR